MQLKTLPTVFTAQVNIASINTSTLTKWNGNGNVNENGNGNAYDRGDYNSSLHFVQSS